MSPGAAETTKQIVESLRCGDNAAWEFFFRTHGPLIAGVVRWSKWRFSPSTQDEVEQGIRTELLRAMQSFDSRSSLPHFIKRVCIHRCIDQVRRQVRERGVLVEGTPDPENDALWDPPDEQPREGFDPVAAILRNERARAVRNMVDQLGSPCAEMVSLFYLDEMPYTAISERLSISVNTVGSRLSRCLDRLRQSVKRFPHLVEDNRGF